MIARVIWWVSLFVIFYAMIGYPYTLFFLKKIVKRNNVKKIEYEPTVTVMVVAHNEENVIANKLNNLLELDYPMEKLEFLIASDFSTDSTNQIVEEFIKQHSSIRMLLHKTVNHYGKTNAQNETQKLCSSEILVMTDANAMLDKKAIKELVSFFSSDDIAYVSGQLIYTNSEDCNTAKSEGTYWNLELKCREIESKIQTIVSGNGAIYAVRNKDYIDVDPIECHDSIFPRLFALKNKKALYNPDAIAYEKAGEKDEDEFNRKVRMNRGILKNILPDFRILNIFKLKWYSLFYFGHKTCRYLLWLSHALLLVSSVTLFGENFFWKSVLIGQLLFYTIAILTWRIRINNKIARVIEYYCMTIIAQWKGVYNMLTGKAKPIWEKAESTR